MLEESSIAALSFAATGIAAITIGLAGAMVWAVLQPSAGLQDRIAGTRLVPV
jgi:hypothetical protein